MKNLKIQTQKIVFSPEEKSICSANFYVENQIVVLFSTGEVMSYDIVENHWKTLCCIEKFYLQHFDLQAKTSILTFGEIIVVFNDFKTHGFIFYPKENTLFPIIRENYQVEHSYFPMAFFENQDKTPFLIYAVDWNRIDILNLDNLHITTADKSLIEVGAEQKRNEFYEKFPQFSQEKRPYPKPFDYFYGEILVSPNQREFLSKGWVWGSADSYKVFDIQKFIAENRISYTFDFQAEHEDRAACWVDKDIIAIGYNTEIEGECSVFYEENAGLFSKESPYVLLIFSRVNGNFQLNKTIKIEKQVVDSFLYYDEALGVFISYSEKGLVIFNEQGEIYVKENAPIKSYSPNQKKFLHFTEKEVLIYGSILDSECF